MSIKKIALGGAAVLLAGSVANASVIDRPFFKVLGTVVVWSAPASGTASGPVVHDFIINTNAAATGDDTDLIAGDGRAVVTGTLAPLAGDTESPSDLLNASGTIDAGSIAVTDTLGNAIGTYKSSFYVASNTAFSIKAAAGSYVATEDFVEAGATPDYSDNINLAMSVNDGGTGTTDGSVTWGEHAQSPVDSSATPFNGYETAKTLKTLDTQPIVFAGDRRTAAARGTIAEQSVRFDMEYNLVDDAGESYDMSMGTGSLQADVTYTVFVP